MPAAGTVLYVGTYTHHGRARGIHVYGVDDDSGELRPIQQAETDDPWFLAASPDRRLLLAANRGDPHGGGAVTVFRIDQATGRLAQVARQAVPAVDPCHLCADPTGRFVVVASHGSGSVTLLPLGPEGSLGQPAYSLTHSGAGPRPEQQRPRVHYVGFGPAGRFLLACDKGADTVFVHSLDQERQALSTHTALALEPGSGPRHLVFGHDGARAYVVNELASSVTVLEFDAQAGSLRAIQTLSTLPDGFGGHNMTAEIALHPSGRLLLASNRGHDSIAVFSVLDDGTLRGLGQWSTRGAKPRHFVIHPSGRWVYVGNQDSDAIELFAVADGALEPLGRVAEVATPLCLRLLL